MNYLRILVPQLSDLTSKVRLPASILAIPAGEANFSALIGDSPRYLTLPTITGDYFGDSPRFRRAHALSAAVAEAKGEHAH